jgi:hypothetical protein
MTLKLFFSITMNFTYPKNRKTKKAKSRLDYCLPKGNQYLNIRCDWYKSSDYNNRNPKLGWREKLKWRFGKEF